MAGRRRGLGILAVVLLAAPAAAPAAVVTATPSGIVVENAQVVPQAPAAAWAALVGEVDRWWPRDHTWWGAESKLSIDATAGGCFCEVAGARQARHMEVGFVDPPGHLRMLGGLGPFQGMGLHGTLDWRLEAVEGGTRISLRYQVGGFTTEDLTKLAAIVDQVQAQQLGGLAEHLRAQARPAPSPEPPGRR